MIQNSWFKLVVAVCLGVLLATDARPAETYTSGVSKEHANGIVAQIMKRVAVELGINLNFRQAPFARRMNWIATGEIDIMGGLLKTQAREAYIYYISPPYVKRNRKVFYVRKGEEDRIREYADLHGLNIGTKIGSRYFPRFDADPTLHKEAVSSVELNFKKLVAGRLDAVIYSNRSGFMKVQEMGLVDRIGQAQYVYKEKNPVYIGISRQSPLLNDKVHIERVVRDLVVSGEIAGIIEDHYKQLGKRMF
jgi:polar amino acid transport system substrate-binding protein